MPSTELTIQFPASLKPEHLAELPALLAERYSILRPSLQPDLKTGKFKDLMTLPPSLVLNQQAKESVIHHIDKLKMALARTPVQDNEFAKITTMVISEMIITLANKDVGESGSEARGKAYLIALEDVNHWAVEAAQRGWYRAEYGSQYDYKWMPEPPILREIALSEERKVRLAIKAMESVLEAQPFVDTSKECEERAIQLKALVGRVRRV